MGQVKRDYFNMIEKMESRWCVKHPTGYWGKDQFGEYYAQCVHGKKKGELCEVGKNDDNISV